MSIVVRKVLVNNKMIPCCYLKHRYFISHFFVFILFRVLLDHRVSCPSSYSLSIRLHRFLFDFGHYRQKQFCNVCKNQNVVTMYDEEVGFRVAAYDLKHRRKTVRRRSALSRSDRLNNARLSVFFCKRAWAVFSRINTVTGNKNSIIVCNSY